MAKVCPNCGKENNAGAKFCEDCGTDVSGVNTSFGSNEKPKSASEGIMGFWNKQGTGGKAVLGIVGVCCIGIILLVVMGGMSTPEKTSNNVTSNQSSNSQPTNTQASITVQDLTIVPEGYGSYTIKGSIIPDKDYSYLEMVLIWYDSSGAIIEKNPLAWNINDVKAGQTLKVSAMGYITGDETPAKVDVLIFDGVFSGGDESSAIYKTTLTL